MRLQDHLDALRRAATLDTLQSAFARAVGRFGFEHYQFVLLNPHPQLATGRRGVVMRHYPESWIRRYERRAYARIDPLHCAAVEHHAPVTWDGLKRQGALTPAQEQLVCEAMEAGLKQVVGIPLHGPGGACAAVELASAGPARVDARTLTQLHMLSLGLYNQYCQMHSASPEPGPQRALSPREQEILVHLAHGCTKAEISGICHISVHTVDHHTRNLLKKLDARNVASAVYRATSRGLIPPG